MKDEIIPIKFFCKICGKEIFQGMSDEIKKTQTVYEVEQDCICSDCLEQFYAGGCNGQ